MIQSGWIRTQLNANKMDFEKNIVLDREKKIKSKLVNTRQIIKNKFKKAFKDRIAREKKSKEKYQPITQAIDKLAETVKPKLEQHVSSESESDESDHLMDVDEYTDGDECPKSTRSREDDSNDDIRKKLRISRRRGVSKELSMRLRKKLNEQRKARNIRAEFRSKTSGKKAKRQLSESDNDEDDSSEYDDEHDVFIKPTESRKKSRLDKSDMDAASNRAREKNNKKIREMRKVNRILEESRESQSNELVPVSYGFVEPSRESDEQSQSDNDSVIYVDADDDRNPSQKRKAATSIFAYNKFVRGMPVPNRRKLRGLKYVGSKSMPKPFLSALDAPHVRSKKRTSTITSSALAVKPAIDNPFMTLDEIIDRVQNPPDSFYEGKKADMGEKKPKKREKKGSGIEMDFIPYNESIAYEFYDDPNELCDRLRLLIASRAAGNSNHIQEINSIISELRELDIIA